MKLSHKLVMVSAAALMGISPVIGAVQNTTAMAATTKKKTAAKSTKKVAKKTTNTKSTKSTKKTTAKKSSKKSTSTKKTVAPAPKADVIVLARNSYVYDQNGKRNKNYKFGGKNWPVIGKGASLNVNGTKTIDGKLYYSIGGNNYIKAVNVASFNGKKVKNSSSSSSTSNTKKIRLTHNAYVYNKNGKRIKSAGTLAKNSTIRYYSTKKIKGKNYFYLGKGQYVKTANAKKVETDDEPKVEDTYITLVKNSIVYDENGDAVVDAKKLSKGGQYQALAAKKINEKWYYQIGEDQWIRAVNAAVSQGPELIDDKDFVAPTLNNKVTDTDAYESIVTLKRDTYTYNNKGIQSSSDKFAAGHRVRVTELTWIWVSSQNKAEKFYRLASDPSGYIKADDISTISGKALLPNNSAQEVQQANTIATANDKSALNTAINGSEVVKNSEQYKLSSVALRNAYDTAVANAQKVNSSSTSTVLEVNNALSDLNKAQTALNGVKVKVANLSQLTSTEADQIAQLAAAANNVAVSQVQFEGNQLLLISASGYKTPLNISDYATIN